MYRNSGIKLKGTVALVGMALAFGGFSPALAGGLGADNALKQESKAKGGDYLPIKRIQPKYPRKAFEEGVGGYVILELTVARDGSVEPGSIKVVKAQPKGVFEKASKEAAEQFQYRPKKVGGVPHPVSGVRYKFSYSVD